MTTAAPSPHNHPAPGGAGQAPVSSAPGTAPGIAPGAAPGAAPPLPGTLSAGVVAGGNAPPRSDLGAAGGGALPVVSEPIGRAATPTRPVTQPHALTEFFDVVGLQELQDSFTGMTGLQMRILGPTGEPLTKPTDARIRHSGDVILEQLLAHPESPDGECADPMVAPIIVDGQPIGSLTLSCRRAWAPLPQERARLEAVYRKLGVDEAVLPRLLDAAEEAFAPSRAAAVQSLLLLAQNLARRWQQASELRNRAEELNALSKLSGLITRHRDVQQVLDAATRIAVEVLGARAAAIRLLDESGKELIEAANCNLSPAYRHKGRVLLEKSELGKAAFAGEVVYVADMATDSRVIYRDGAESEGLVSALIAGMLYRGRPVGLLQVYSGEPHVFTRHEVSLLQSLAQLTATAIENARLDAHRAEAQRVQRQLHLAADVQRRMIPSVMPKVPGLDMAARYVPSFELGGDFFDFLNLGGNLGVAVGDVVGKGIAASLLMAGVRGGLRAFAQEVYDIDQIIGRVNRTLCFDTLPNEFATLFYGVIHRETLRLTYCNGGHDPGLLLRDGKLSRLEVGGMVLGIDPDQVYQRGILDLRPGDLLVLHTDGLVDALNFNNKNFGRDRVIQAMRDRAGAPAQVILDHLLWEMRRFTGLNRNTDDTTIVVIKVTDEAPRQGAGRPKPA